MLFTRTRSMNLLRAAVLLTLCSVLPGCILYGEGCTDEFTPSFILRVEDAEGRAVPDIRVTYTLDGGPQHEAHCTILPVAPGACEEWWAAHDQRGVFHIKAETLDGTRSAETRVTVGGDMCHANSETVRLTLL
jgi:hypothetical protein